MKEMDISEYSYRNGYDRGYKDGYERGKRDGEEGYKKAEALVISLIRHIKTGGNDEENGTEP